MSKMYYFNFTLILWYVVYVAVLCSIGMIWYCVMIQQWLNHVYVNI